LGDVIEDEPAANGDEKLEKIPGGHLGYSTNKSWNQSTQGLIPRCLEYMIRFW
jgi:hypothetical protein